MQFSEAVAAQAIKRALLFYALCFINFYQSNRSVLASLHLAFFFKTH